MNWKERLEKKKPEEIVPFVDGWDFVGVLGEGAFGEVRSGISTYLAGFSIEQKDLTVEN